MKTRFGITALTAAVVIFLSLVCSQLLASSSRAPDTDRGVDLLWGLKIPMRDGVRLNATVYKPKGMTAPLPVIFTLTPYIADSYHPRAMYFARNDYVYVLVDCRGRGNSEGRFDPFVNEARDGYDIVEWLARQPWSNGKIAMWGGSYAGFDQWSTLKEFPPHLETIVPAASVHVGIDYPFFKNIFYSYDIQWLSYTSGLTPNEKLFGEGRFWQDKFSELYMNHLPFQELDKVVGNTSTVFQTWIQHPVPDDYWGAMVPSIEQYKRITIPILTITGHYDDDQPGAMRYYRMHMQHGSEEARSRHYLIIGPWDHAGTRTPNRDVGGLKFGEASMLDLNKMNKDWYDWILKGAKKPEFLKKRVAYYVLGLEEWKYAESLESISNSKRTLFLYSDGKADSAFHSGRLNEEKPVQAAADHYTYDPLDTRPAELENEEVPNYLTDQRSALNLFGNGLVYHSEPFTQDMEITGCLKFVAWIAMDVPDTDFQVSVYEISRDGTSVLLSSDLLRARYHESLKVERLLKAGEINRYEFDGFTFFSRVVRKGNRLRLVFKSPNTISLEKNYNSGGVVAEESGKNARTAHITVYHDAEHPSFLELPVVK